MRPGNEAKLTFKNVRWQKMVAHFSWLRASCLKSSSYGRFLRTSSASHWKWKPGKNQDTHATRNWGGDCWLTCDHFQTLTTCSAMVWDPPTHVHCVSYGVRPSHSRPLCPCPCRHSSLRQDVVSSLQQPFHPLWEPHDDTVQEKQHPMALHPILRRSHQLGVREVTHQSDKVSHTQRLSGLFTCEYHTKSDPLPGLPNSSSMTCFIRGRGVDGASLWNTLNVCTYSRGRRYCRAPTCCPTLMNKPPFLLHIVRSRLAERKWI